MEMINYCEINKAIVKEEMLPTDFTFENPSVDIDSCSAGSADTDDAMVNHLNTIQDGDAIERTPVNHVQTDSHRRKRVAYNNRNGLSENVQIDEELKQEDVEKSQVILNEVSSEDIVSSNLEYHYQCHTCNKKMATLKSFLEHLEILHDIKHRSIVIKHIDLEPDLHDPDYYCRACEYSYSNLSGYRSHLKTTHYMVLKPLPKLNRRPTPHNPNFHCRSCDTVFSNKIRHRQHFLTGAQIVKMKKQRKNLDDVPDWNDPDYYCRVCDFTYTEALYHQHCEIVHQMNSLEEEMSKLCRPDLDDPNFYCKVCDITYQSRRSFRDHCRNVHLITVKIFESFNAKPNTSSHTSDTEEMSPNQIEDNNNDITIPDITIPAEKIINTFCRVCDEDLSSELDLRLHMLSIHSIYEPSQVINHLKPDIDDPNYYCRTCNWKAATKGKYNAHLRSVHNITPKNSRKASNYSSDFLPDPYDPSFYCRVCKITKLKKNEYRSHCRKIHHMTLEPLSFPYPDAVIDINSPDHYCAKCDMHYKGKQSFRHHLKSVHKLKLITNGGIAYPDAIVDMLNPNFYCAQCDKHYSKKWNFKLHLINVHNLIDLLAAEKSSSKDHTLEQQ